MVLKKRIPTQDNLPFSTGLTLREKNELEIQHLTANMPVEKLDTPEKIKAWAEKDE